MDIELAQALEENAKLKTDLKTAYRKGMRHMAKALKDYDRKFGAWTDYFEHTVDAVLQEELEAFEENENYMTVQNAMETIKRYCKEITDERSNCSKCIFCSKGFNGCRLQRAPCEWEY